MDDYTGNTGNWLAKLWAHQVLEEETRSRIPLSALRESHDFYWQGGKVYMKGNDGEWTRVSIEADL